MITRGSRFYFGLALLAWAGAIVYGLSTGGHAYGVFSLGYKEGVGEQFGYTVLIGVAIVSAMLGFVTEAFRDADPEAQASLLELDAVPATEAPQSLSPWPIIAAFSAGFLVVGLVYTWTLFVIGLIGLGICAVEWAVKNWADHQTGDPAVNQAIRNRLMYPIEIPVGVLLGMGLLVVATSRVLLAIPKDASVVVAIVVAVIVLAVASLIAQRPQLSANVVSALLLLGGVALLAGGIAAGAAGTREIEEHHDEHEYEEPPVGGELPPERPTTTTTEAGGATSPTTTMDHGGDEGDTTTTTTPGAQSDSSDSESNNSQSTDDSAEN